MLAYETLIRYPGAFRSFAGMTPDEFDNLLATFTAAQARRQRSRRTTRQGQPRQRAAGAGHPHRHAGEPAVHVHHRDEDPLHNALSNLRVMEPGEHHRQHAAEGGGDSVLWRVGLDVVASIRPHGSTTTCALTVCALFFPE